MTRTPPAPIHGTARLSRDGKLLTITTQAKRGAKMVDNIQTYLVEDARPDPRVCSPAFRLTKGRVITDAFDPSPYCLGEFEPSGEVYHVGFNEWGPFCDCGHATFRGSNSMEVCKHAKSVKALLPLLMQFQEADP